jgi:uncharacterized membrane protein YphA (DoxX/SURF4 family)
MGVLIAIDLNQHGEISRTVLGLSLCPDANYRGVGVFLQWGEKIVRRVRWPGRAGAVAQFPAQYWFAAVIEFFGGVLVAIGLFTGYAAFIASGEMAVAYFQNHFPKGFWPILNTGERAVFYCFTFLFISSRGAVRWGLDNFFSSRGKR